MSFLRRVSVVCGLLLLVCLLMPGVGVAQQWTNSGTNDIANTNTGNVGVGGAPAAKFDVTTFAGNDGITIHGNNVNGPALKIKNSVSGGHEYEFISNGPINDGGLGALQFWDNTDGFARMVILPTSGNIGVGTNTPNAKLDVTTSAGNDGITIHGNNVNGPALKIKNSVSGGHEYELISNGPINDGGLGALQFWDNTDGFARMVILPTSGNIGVGTSTPGQKLEVRGSIKLSAGSGGALIFQDGTTQTTAIPGSTSSVCQQRSGLPSADCSCAIRLVSKTLAPSVSPGSSQCIATSNTGTCSGSGGQTFSGACCVCAPN